MLKNSIFFNVELNFSEKFASNSKKNLKRLQKSLKNKR